MVDPYITPPLRLGILTSELVCQSKRLPSSGWEYRLKGRECQSMAEICRGALGWFLWNLAIKCGALRLRSGSQLLALVHTLSTGSSIPGTLDSDGYREYPQHHKRFNLLHQLMKKVKPFMMLRISWIAVTTVGAWN